MGDFLSSRSFVHDPKMAKQAVVKATVKLQFRGNDQENYVGKKVIFSAFDVVTIIHIFPNYIYI
jgi:hypothetical protein